MTYDLLWAFVIFCFTTSFTPGPNNMMLLASGVNFGFLRSLPHMLGVALGFGMMVFLVGFGLGALLAGAPMLKRAMQVAGILYMLYLAYKIATSAAMNDRNVGKPFTFLEAAAFQWVNPKGWMMALSATANYALHSEPVTNAAILGGVYTLTGLPSSALWAGFGVGLRRLLSNPLVLKAFNITMALLLVASLWPVVREMVVDRW